MGKNCTSINGKDTKWSITKPEYLLKLGKTQVDFLVCRTRFLINDKSEIVIVFFSRYVYSTIDYFQD